MKQFLKLFQIVSIFILLLPSLVFAEIRNYGVDVAIEETNAFVKIFITFEKVEQKNFEMFFNGKIYNFNATSTANQINCKVLSEKISKINCNFVLKEDKKTIGFNFETKDLIAKIGNVFYFNGDFSVWQDIKEAFIVVRLPEGYVLSEESSILPKDAIITSDERGRRIVVVWRLNDIKASQPLKFQLAFEPTFFFLPILRLGAIVGIFLASILLIYLKRIRKPEEVVLSVLDEYERKVFEIIRKKKQVRQRRVVQETNFSKAKVSRIVKNLENRGLIEVEKVGRTNILKLKKKFFSL